MSLEYPCLYYKDEQCAKFTDAEHVSFCVRGPCPYETPTIGDRFREMDDAALARVLVGLTEEEGRIPYCKGLPECSEDLEQDRLIPPERCAGCMQEWLGLAAPVPTGSCGSCRHWWGYAGGSCHHPDRAGDWPLYEIRALEECPSFEQREEAKDGEVQ